jgi:hypothetical protein
MLVLISVSFDFSFQFWFLSSDFEISESDFPHLITVEEIPTVKDDRGFHGIADLIEIHMLKFWPFGG